MNHPLTKVPDSPLHTAPPDDDDRECLNCVHYRVDPGDESEWCCYESKWECSVDEDSPVPWERHCENHRFDGEGIDDR